MKGEQGMRDQARVLSEDELGQLLVRHRDQVLRWTIKMTGSKVVAEDVVSASCIKALRARGSYQEGGNFPAWIFRIVRNEYINHYRQQKSRKTDNLTEKQIEFLRESGTPESTAGYHELLRLIATEIEWQHRDVLLAICVEGLDYEECAKRYRISVGTVKSRLWRARAKVKLLLEAQ